ncbi:TIR domain-containing protein [Bacillus sp. Marseille-P3661]|uniref:TIR domain-containing protein n=1 Tax=Bacillus sp. Marseille-P3661 TaxID=1936234 RepID=UPI000C86216D|nr:TIR domain-containing protein [Bacillus sp. Marseille-P3661]
MAYRNGNYSAFYVSEPFSESNLGASATRDFVSYNLLRAWKAADSSFPFNDSHNKTYNVRDGSDWEKTLKPRLRERLNNSKNIILFLSSVTKNSRALREEINYGIGTKGLPVIVVYPEYQNKSDIINCKTNTIKDEIKTLWAKLPAFRDSMAEVPTLHLPFKKDLIKSALNDTDFMINSKCSANIYFYKC